MTVLDDKYSVLEETASEGFLRTYRVRKEDGPEGRLYWFEVHTPQARTAFHRYKNALKRLEGAEYLIPGVQTSANPGRYYVFWPAASKFTVKPKKLKPILEALEPFGYQGDDLGVTEEAGRPLVCDLKPQINPLPISRDNIPALPGEPGLKPQTLPQTPAAEVAPALGVSKSQLGTARPQPLGTHTPAKPEAKTAPAKSNPVVKPMKTPKPPRPARRYPLNWPGWVPGLILLAVGSWLIYGVALRYLNPPEYQLPDLVGKTPTQAYDAVKNLGLKVAFAEGSDPSLPKDQILEQTPDPGSKVKPGRRLELIINKPKFGLVPTVSGRSLEDAKQALDSAGYTVKGITRIASGDTKDTVLSSLPREGQPLKSGEGVRLLVSSGVRPAPRETLLPDLTGLSEDEARYILNVAELTPVVRRVASGAPEGTVIGQDPGPGVTLSRETIVRLQVAAQPAASIPKASPFEPPPLEAPPPPP
ncbi:MAG: serine/threonine kinase, partial [Meiothermus sp.]